MKNPGNRSEIETFQEKRAVRLARPKFWEETPMRGACDNVLSGEISVAAVQKMMLHKRKVKHLKCVCFGTLSYCHIIGTWHVLHCGNGSFSNL